MFDTFAALLRGLAIGLLIALVLLLALPGAKAGRHSVPVQNADAVIPAH